MNVTRMGVALIACACIAPLRLSAAATPAGGPVIRIEDVGLFYAVYDAASGRPTAEQLQRDYLDKGSEGLREFAKLRNITGARIADTLTKKPEIYSDARRCMAVLPRVRERLEKSLRTLGELYPEAQLPPVTIAVGRGKPVGVGGPGMGVKIGLEALCATNYLNPDVEDRFVHVIAHEFAHVQQAQELADKVQPTVLELSLLEGAAEVIAELISGNVAYSHLKALTQGREHEIESAFAADLDKTDLSAWLNNGTAEKPGDLGYWVGYRIVRAYLHNAPDKRVALREILQMTDARAFLSRSGWSPELPLPEPEPLLDR